MTNADRIRQMSDEDLALVLMCPYETAGDPVNIMPCIKDYGTLNPTQEYCHACLMNWLQRDYRLFKDKPLEESKWRSLDDEG